MNRYTIYCTEAQIKKALKLNAPIQYDDELPSLTISPTAEEMIGWLEEYIHNIIIIKSIDNTWLYLFCPTNLSKHEIKTGYLSRKDATLAVIDSALEYLSNNK